MTELVREVANTRSLVNERFAATATGPLFRVCRLETLPARLSKNLD